MCACIPGNVEEQTGGGGGLADNRPSSTVCKRRVTRPAVRTACIPCLWAVRVDEHPTSPAGVPKKKNAGLASTDGFRVSRLKSQLERVPVRAGPQAAGGSKFEFRPVSTHRRVKE